MFRYRTAALAAIVSLGLVGQAVLAGTAGAVTATRSQLTNGELRLEGQAAPGIFVTASSTTSAAGARADQKGQFKIQASNFTAPDCMVTISDGRTPTATVALSGCTPTVVPVPPVPAPPTGSCVITPQDPVTLTAGANTSVYFLTTGCASSPLQWTVVAGVIPTGMTGPNFQGTTAGNIIGTPSIPKSYQFTLQVTDETGATDQENFTVNVV